jgi:hypothetical protein
MIAVQTNDGVWRAEDSGRPPIRPAIRASCGRAATPTRPTGTGHRLGRGVDDLAAPAVRRSPVRLGSRHRSTCPRRCRGRTSSSTYTTSTERHRAADHAPGPHDLRHRSEQDPAGPVVGGLEDRRRAPDRGQGGRTTTRTSGCSRRRRCRRSRSPAGRSRSRSWAASERPTIQGDPGTQLESYLSRTVTVPPGTIASSQADSFALPPRRRATPPRPPFPPVRHSLGRGVSTTKARAPSQRSRGDQRVLLEFGRRMRDDNAGMQGRVTPGPCPRDIGPVSPAPERRRVVVGVRHRYQRRRAGRARRSARTTSPPGPTAWRVHNWAARPGNPSTIKSPS